MVVLIGDTRNKTSARRIDVIDQQSEEERAEGEGFTEAFDPNAEPGELPVEEAPVEETAASEGEDEAEG